jgi:hypothetical protein
MSKGGARPGAGRPAGKTATMPISLRVSATTHKKWETTKRKTKLSGPKLIEQLLKNQ